MSETLGSLHQQFERAEAQYFILDVAHQGAPLNVVDDDAVFIQQAPHQDLQVVAYLLLGQALHAFQVDAVEQGLVHVLLEFLVGGIVDAAAAHGAEGRIAVRGRGTAEAFAQAGACTIDVDAHAVSPRSWMGRLRWNRRENRPGVLAARVPPSLRAHSCSDLASGLPGASFSTGTPWLTDAAATA